MIGNKIKVLTISAATLLAASSIVAIGTYALFTDSVTLENHLVAGNLDITLKRTNLEYSYLDSEGMPHDDGSDTTVVDFSEATSENVFGLESTTKFVPGDFRAATLELSNSSSVAFNWYFSIQLTSTSNDFAEQLLLEVETDSTSAGYEYSKHLDEGVEAGTAAAPLGTVKVGETKTFVVKVSFDDTQDNNNAMDLTVDFDLTVYAVQKTLNN